MFSLFKEVREAFRQWAAMEGPPAMLPPSPPEKTWPTNRLLKLDIDGNMALTETDLVPRIKSLSAEDKLRLLPILVTEISAGAGSGLTVMHLEKMMNTVKGTVVTPTLPVFLTGRLKRQEIRDVNTGVISTENSALVVEIADLVRMGSVGMRVKIQNLSTKEKRELLSLLENELAGNDC